jgi:hypothetical protein
MQGIAHCSRQGQHALANQLAYRVLDALRAAIVDELLGESLDGPCLRLDLAQQHHADIGADCSAVEFPHHGPLSKAMECKVFPGTRRHPRVPRGSGYKVLIAQTLFRTKEFFPNPLARFPG